MGMKVEQKTVLKDKNIHAVLKGKFHKMITQVDDHKMIHELVERILTENDESK